MIMATRPLFISLFCMTREELESISKVSSSQRGQSRTYTLKTNCLKTNNKLFNSNNSTELYTHFQVNMSPFCGICRLDSKWKGMETDSIERNEYKRIDIVTRIDALSHESFKPLRLAFKTCGGLHFVV
ncbi:hypothetical protein GQR58_027767 [Nymphon striatum]|nr:hypothetical protein GQR58_027767 [Nymphon striatum]